MKRNEEILALSQEIMANLTDSRQPLYMTLLKASRLSLLLDIPANVTLFKDWAKFAEQNQFVLETYKTNVDAARDTDTAVGSANPQQYVRTSVGNVMERFGLRDEAKKVAGFMAGYRAETYTFVSGIYAKWRFGNIAETVFEKKRNRTEPILRTIFPDIGERLNSIEQNIVSENPEDWKNAVASCRTLLMDIADILNPPKTPDEKGKYINRLKDFVSPLLESETARKYQRDYFDELKKRIDHVLDFTQGGAHKDRPQRFEVENVVLITYLLTSDLMEIYNESRQEIISSTPSVPTTEAAQQRGTDKAGE